jgi:hypothetical protein
MARFVKLDDRHIVNGDRVVKIHFIGRWDNVFTLKDVDVTDILQRLGA